MPTCPHRPPCGGCPLLALDDAAALVRKRERVVQALARFGWAPDLVAPCLPAPSRTGYRTRAKLAVAEAGSGRVRIGLFRPGSHEVVDIPGCLVLAPALHPVLDSLRELGGGIALRHVDLRYSRATRKIHATLVTDGAEGPYAALARRLHERHPELSGASLRRTGGAVPRALMGAHRLLGGEEGLEEHLAGRRFHLSPGAFFQVDPAAAERLHEVVRAWLLAPDAGGRPPRHLLDLYAGVGAFALSLADGFARTAMVESVAAAIEDAHRSARLSRVTLEIHHAEAAAAAERAEIFAADRVVVDPPRRGLEARVLAALGEGACARLAYVACDPETAARDAAVLAAYGFALRGVQPLDGFANTEEVETVFLLERVASAAPLRVLHDAGDVVVVDKPAALPTHPQAERERNVRDLVRAATGRPDLQPAHRLDVGTSGPLVFARGEALARLGQAFAAGLVHKEYLALVRGVPHRKGRVRVPASPQGGAEESRFVREDVVGGYGLVRVTPLTGRHHQVRRHMARIGHPLLGDTRYGEPRTNRFLAEAAGLTRPFLHLAKLDFPAADGGRVVVEAPLAPELRLVLDRLVRLRAGATLGPVEDD